MTTFDDLFEDLIATDGNYDDVGRPTIVRNTKGDTADTTTLTNDALFYETDAEVDQEDGRTNVRRGTLLIKTSQTTHVEDTYTINSELWLLETMSGAKFGHKALDVYRREDQYRRPTPV